MKGLEGSVGGTDLGTPGVEKEPGRLGAGGLLGKGKLMLPWK